MDRSEDRALKVAEFLLDIRAVELNLFNPFTWASGLKSPVYCDNRKTLSYPIVRSALKAGFRDLIREQFGSVECLAAVATGGIALGALTADELNLPLVYVRSEAKKHGLNNQVEGRLEPGAKVVVIEDLVSTGGSSLKAVEALRAAGAEVLGMIAIFTYGFPSATERFKQAQVKLFCLSTFDVLIQTAAKKGLISEAQLATLNNWKENPQQWSGAPEPSLTKESHDPD